MYKRIEILFINFVRNKILDELFSKIADDQLNFVWKNGENSLEKNRKSSPLSLLHETKEKTNLMKSVIEQLLAKFVEKVRKIKNYNIFYK